MRNTNEKQNDNRITALRADTLFEMSVDLSVYHKVRLLFYLEFTDTNFTII